ncbi:hypothetical protein AVEN_186954-1 [Araneus ventricosus]|uniref:Uncharacterized protein n=1 Tax=Araneus ventricosus TaxID=182803 RepID=A0A4Y2SS08_ARAVE|nr:hypothetical protein AVEN_186954-1 [Araneus ventricosus]
MRSGQTPSRCCGAEVSRRDVPSATDRNLSNVGMYACYENDGKVLTACMEDDATYIVTCCLQLQDYEENQQEWSPLNVLVYFQAKVLTRSPYRIDCGPMGRSERHENSDYFHRDWQHVKTTKQTKIKYSKRK